MPTHLHFPMAVARWALLTAIGMSVDQQLLGSATACLHIYALSFLVLVLVTSAASAWLGEGLRSRFAMLWVMNEVPALSRQPSGKSSSSADEELREHPHDAGTSDKAASAGCSTSAAEAHQAGGPSAEAVRSAVPHAAVAAAPAGAAGAPAAEAMLPTPAQRPAASERARAAVAAVEQLLMQLDEAGGSSGPRPAGQSPPRSRLFTGPPTTGQHMRVGIKVRRSCLHTAHSGAVKVVQVGKPRGRCTESMPRLYLAC